MTAVLPTTCPPAVSPDDLDRDDVGELIVCHHCGHIYRLDSRGGLHWTDTTPRSEAA